MTNTYRELVLDGVLVAPAVRYAALALVLFLMSRPLLHFVGFSKLFSNPALAVFSVYVVIFGLLTSFL